MPKAAARGPAQGAPQIRPQSRPRTRPGGRPAPNSEPAPSYEALTQKAFLAGLRLISRPRGADRAAPSYGVAGNRRAVVKRAAVHRRPLARRKSAPRIRPRGPGPRTGTEDRDRAA